MKMQFSFRRIFLLLVRYFFENRNRELLFWSVITLVFTILDHRDFVLLVLFVSGIYYSLRLNKDLSDKRGIHYLMIPSTHTEKLVSTLFLNTAFHFGMILLAYAIGNLLIMLVYHYILKYEIPVNWDLFQETTSVETDGVYNMYVENVFWKTWGSFALLQAVFTLASLYFKRHVVLKTLLTFFLLGSILVFIQMFLFKTLWDVKYLYNAIFPVLAMISNSEIPVLVDKAYNYGIILLLPFLWIVSYFRLTEKQV